MKMMKKIAVAVLALALTAGMTMNCMAGSTWGSYFGREDGKGHAIWYEGAKGTLKSQSATGWTADMQEIGWGGVWGGQVYQDEAKGNGKVGVKKGTQYTLKCTLNSSGCDKWVLIKIATKEDFAYAKWIKLKKGQTTTVNETFEAKANANSIYFGIGGEFGDREDEAKPYTWAEGGQSAIKNNSDGDDKAALHSTVITCSGYSLTEASSNTNPGGDNGGSTNTNTNTTPTNTSTTVTTGDFEPFAFGAIAVLAAAAVVVFSKRKEA